MIRYIISIIIVGIFLISGCATLIERGKVTQDNEGKNVYTPEEYIRIKGIGSAEFPGGYKGEGKPMIQLPPLSLKKEE